MLGQLGKTYQKQGYWGLGIKTMSLMNEALLSMQLWRLTTNKNTLIHKLVNAKYFSKTNILETASKQGRNYVFLEAHVSLFLAMYF